VAPLVLTAGSAGAHIVPAYVGELIRGGVAVHLDAAAVGRGRVLEMARPTRREARRQRDLSRAVVFFDFVNGATGLVCHTAARGGLAAPRCGRVAAAVGGVLPTAPAARSRSVDVRSRTARRRRRSSTAERRWDRQFGLRCRRRRHSAAGPAAASATRGRTPSRSAASRGTPSRSSPGRSGPTRRRGCLRTGGRLTKRLLTTLCLLTTRCLLTT
jgi:hypothetical protein